MNVEREAKLLVGKGFTLPELGDLDGGLRATPAMPRHLESVYYDTADLALARSGVTLRYRTGEPGGAWTLKLPRARSDAALVRAEIGFDAPAGAVPAQARDLVRAYLRGRPLVEVARFRTDRVVVRLCDQHGVRLAEVVHDTVADAEHDRGFDEVEVELTGPAGTELLHTVVGRLVTAGARTGRPVPKVVRLLGERAVGAPDVRVPEPGPRPTLAALVHRALAGPVAELIDRDPGVRLGEDPEDVHKFRVATRRLRSDLKTFAAVLDREWVSRLRVELAWLGAEVGAVRDADVLYGLLADQAATLPGADAGAAAILLDHLALQRDRKRATMLSALRGSRYDALLAELVRAADTVPFDADPDLLNRPADRFVARVTRGQWRRLDRAVRALGEPATDPELHRVRILAKRCRYAAEAAKPAIGRPAARFAAGMADVQTVLGDHQDAIVTEQWLRTAASEDPRIGVAAGELVALQRTRRAALRSDWPAVWRKAAARPRRTWLRQAR
jgi:CHAD domain-containing protein